MKLLKRPLAILTVLVLLLAGLMIAAAEEQTGYDKTEKLKVFTSQSTSSGGLGTMRKGQMLTVFSVKNGWCEVKNSKDAVNCCKASELSAKDSDVDKCWISYGGTISVYGANGEETGTAWFGQCYTFVKTENEKTWFKNSKGEIGYLDSDYITRTNPFIYNDTVYTQCGGKMLYKKAQVKGKGVTLEKDTKLTLRAVSDDKTWAIVEYKGKQYYILYLLIDSEKAPSEGREYTVTGQWWLNETEDWSSKVISNLEEGDKVRLLGISGWGVKLETSDGTIGYAPGLPIR